LRLNFKVDEERIARLSTEPAFSGLREDEKGAILAALAAMPTTLYRNRVQFQKALTKDMKEKGVTVRPPIKKAILKTLSERDEEADICADSEGNPERRRIGASQTGHGGPRPEDAHAERSAKDA
jgi:type I restriction enzyme M protein